MNKSIHSIQFKEQRNKNKNETIDSQILKASDDQKSEGSKSSLFVSVKNSWAAKPTCLSAYLCCNLCNPPMPVSMEMLHWNFSFLFIIRVSRCSKHSLVSGDAYVLFYELADHASRLWWCRRSHDHHTSLWLVQLQRLLGEYSWCSGFRTSCSFFLSLWACILVCNIAHVVFVIVIVVWKQETVFSTLTAVAWCWIVESWHWR